MALPSFAAGPRDDACWGEAPIFGRGGGQKTHQNNKLLCACGRETIQCHRGYGGQGPIPGIIVGGRDTTAGVAELADAQDLGSCGRKAVKVQILSSAPRFKKYS